MSEKPSNIYKKYGILVLACFCLIILVSASVSPYLQSSLNVKQQSASVSLAQSSCFSSAEMLQIQSSKQNIAASITSENEKLDSIEADIVKTAKEYSEYTEEVDKLRLKLVTEQYLNGIKTDIEATQKRIQELDALETSALSGVCSAPGYFDKNSCENASGPAGGSCSAQWYTDPDSCTSAGYYEGGGCSGSGYYDKPSCESAGYSYSILTGKQSSGTCSGGDQYPNEASCTSAGYYTGGGCSDPTYVDRYSCENAGYYQDGGTCSNPYYTNQQTCESENFVWSNDGAFAYSGNTWSESTFVSSGYTWNQPWYEELTEVTTSYGYVWKEPQWVNAGYTWTHSTYTPYGYTWIDASEANTKQNLTTSLENLAKEYQEKIVLRNEQMKEIGEKEALLESKHNNLKDLSVQKVSIREKIAGLEAEMQAVELGASKGVCQAYEVSCSDSLDNDNDLAVDCSDSDCSLEASCSKTTGPITGTSTTPGTTPPVSTTPEAPLFSTKFSGTFSTVGSLTNNILLVNSRDIVPGMKDLKTLAAATTTTTQILFSKISSVKATVESNIATVTKLRTALMQLRTENSQTTDIPLKTETDKLVTVGISFVSSLVEYHMTLLKFLDGSVPTPELDVELNQRIADTTTKGGAYKAQITPTNVALNAAVKKAETLALGQVSVSTGALRASSISPRPGEIDVSVSTNEIIIAFLQNINTFNKATVSVKDSTGDTIQTTESMKARKTFAIGLDEPLKAGEVYTVSVSGLFVEEVTLDEFSWSQSWSFATEKRGSVIIGTIIDIIDDIFGLGGGKKEAEVCDDGKDNDGNGVADCSDKACEDDEACKQPVCGNGKVEKGEECDDGNNVAGDGCTGCQVDNEGGGCTDDNEDGYDDKDTTQRCGCLDKDDDGKDDIDGASCVVSSESSCLICQYEIDYIEGFEDRFKNRCESRTATKKIIQQGSIYGDEVSQCPKNTTRYDFEIAGHSCAANFARLSGAMKKSLTTIRNNIYSLSPAERSAFHSKTISINGVDNGCHSAGGLFSRGNNWYNSFGSLLKSVEGQFFLNDVEVNLIGNQTYGYARNERTTTTDGRVRLSSFVKNDSLNGVAGDHFPGNAGQIKVLYSSCPLEGERCSAPVNNPYLIQERIVCGEVAIPRNFYCSTDYNADVSYTLYNGKWVEEK